MPQEELKAFQESGKITVCGHEISGDDLHVVRKFNGDAKRNEAAWDRNALIVLDCLLTDELKNEGEARMVVNKVQKLRKEVSAVVYAVLYFITPSCAAQLGLKPSDKIDIWYEVSAADSSAGMLLDTMQAFIADKTKSKFAKWNQHGVEAVGRKTFEVIYALQRSQQEQKESLQYYCTQEGLYTLHHSRIDGIGRFMH